MPKYTKLSEQEFKDIKSLVDLHKLTAAEISRLTKRSKATVANIKRCDSYDAYKVLIREYMKSSSTASDATVENGLDSLVDPPIQPEVNQDELRRLVTNINDSLTQLQAEHREFKQLVSLAIEILGRVEAFTERETRRGFFGR